MAEKHAHPSMKNIQTENDIVQISADDLHVPVTGSHCTLTFPVQPAFDQARELVKISCNGLSSLQVFRLQRGGDGQGPHAGSPCSLNTQRSIFDDETGLGPHSELFCGLQPGFRVRLTFFDIVCSDKCGKKRPQFFRQSPAHHLIIRSGHNRGSDAPADHAFDDRHDLGKDDNASGIAEIVRLLVSGQCATVLLFSRKAVTAEKNMGNVNRGPAFVKVHIFFSNIQPLFSKNAHPGACMARHAVDDNAVKIKKHSPDR